MSDKEIDFQVVFERLHKLNTMLPPVDWRFSVLGLYTELSEVQTELALPHIPSEEPQGDLLKEFGDVIGTAVRVATYWPVQAHDFVTAVGDVRVGPISRPRNLDACLDVCYWSLGQMVNSLPWRPWRIADQRQIEWREAQKALPYLARVVRIGLIAMEQAGFSQDDIYSAVAGHVQAKYDRVANQIDGYAK